ncbi:AAA family ATPase [Massilia kyonggiensis]|nr:AAA family ATPase [Massilia kyonggiensis]
MLDNGPASPGVVACEQATNYQFIIPQFDNIPEKLKNLARWLLWKAESMNGGKPRKVPYCPTLLNVRGSSTDPNTWGTFAQAEAAFDEGGYTGIAFVLNGDGIVGIDIDQCMVNGQPSMSAMTLMQQLGVEYIEVSPSGTGLRGFGYAEKLEKGVNGNLDGLKVELYSDRRLLTVTGRVLKSGPLVRLNGFADLANTIRANTVSKSVCLTANGVQEDRHGTWVRQVISGEVYHDSLRDMAGSLIASGTQPGVVVSHLRGLMQSSQGPHDDRWKARVDEIPRLVDSAVKKFSPQVVDLSRVLRPMQSSANDGASSQRFKILSAAQLAQAEPIKWMVRGLLPQVGLAALYGPSGSGKSFLTLDLGASVASGVSDWYGMRITQCPVTYCVLEGESGMGKRIAAWEKYKAQKMPDALRFITQQVDITSASDVEEMAHAICDAGGAHGLIVLDTLNRAAPGADENSSKDMGVIIANAKALQQLTGGMVLLVHHTGKDESKGMRGHSSLFAAMDCVIGVVTGQGLSWTVAKSKDDVTGTLHGFRLEQVVVGQDDDGDDITSCMAVSITPPFAQRGAKKLGRHQQIACDVLRAKFNEEGAAITYAAAYDAIAAVIDVDPKHKRERAKDAVKALAAHGMVELTETHIARLPALGH